MTFWLGPVVIIIITLAAVMLAGLLDRVLSEHHARRWDARDGYERCIRALRAEDRDWLQRNGWEPCRPLLSRRESARKVPAREGARRR